MTSRWWAALALLVGAGTARAQVERKDAVKVGMRDGVTLVSDLWLPSVPGKHPTIIVRTPYGRRGEWMNGRGVGEYFAARGYAVVVQDVRGTGESGGTFAYLFQEINDGYDAIEWIARQPWSNGRVATMGLSYFGASQWVTARTRPPHLVCLAPTAAGGLYFNELPYVGGAFGADWALHWLNRFGPDRVDPGKVDWAQVARHRPLRTMDSVMGRVMPIYRDFLDHSTMDGYWRKLQYFDEDFAETTLPSLTITGWFDGNQPGALFYWRGMRKHSPARDRQYLLAGPWDHQQTWTGGGEKLGAFAWGKAGIVDYRPIQLAWFDYCLKGSTPTFAYPRARIFVTGSNEWRDLPDYPPAGSTVKSLYLRGNGRANTSAGDGRLEWQGPVRETADRYTFDPHDPAPGPDEDAGTDLRPLQTRADVLVYTSAALARPLTVIGQSKLELFAASDGFDTDFAAVLIDRFPDGRSIMIGPKIGMIRARYRTGYNQEVPLVPGRPTRLMIDLYDMAHTFLPGHRIQVQLSSAASPHFNPNQNTGNPVATDTVWRVAHQMILHEGTFASRLLLPVFTPP